MRTQVPTQACLAIDLSVDLVQREAVVEKRHAGSDAYPGACPSAYMSYTASVL